MKDRLLDLLPPETLMWWGGHKVEIVGPSTLEEPPVVLLKLTNIKGETKTIALRIGFKVGRERKEARE